MSWSRENCIEIHMDRDLFPVLQEVLVDSKYHVQLPEDNALGFNLHKWYEDFSSKGRFLSVSFTEELSVGDNHDPFFTPKYNNALNKCNGSEFDICQFLLTLGLDMYRRCPGAILSIDCIPEDDSDCEYGMNILYNHVRVGIINNELYLSCESGLDKWKYLEYVEDNTDIDVDWDNEEEVNRLLEEAKKEYGSYYASVRIGMNNGSFCIIEGDIKKKSVVFSAIQATIDRENKLLEDIHVDVQAEFDKAVQEGKRSSFVQITFPDGSCSMFSYDRAVNEGDKVLVSGRFSNMVGTVTQIKQYWPWKLGSSNFLDERVLAISKNEEELFNGDNAPWDYEAISSEKIRITKCNLKESDIVIPKRIDGKFVTEIGEYAFDNCIWIKTVVIPEGVTKIGVGAFRGCSEMTSIDIPDSVSSIKGCSYYGIGAFYNCRSLKSIRIPEKLKEIDDLIFEGCSGLTRIIVPDGIKLIRSGAFQRCTELTYFEVANDQVEFRAAVFQGCDKLKSITTRDGKKLELPGGALCI